MSSEEDAFQAAGWEFGDGELYPAAQGIPNLKPSRMEFLMSRPVQLTGIKRKKREDGADESKADAKAARKGKQGQEAGAGKANGKTHSTDAAPAETAAANKEGKQQKQKQKVRFDDQQGNGMKAPAEIASELPAGGNQSKKPAPAANVAAVTTTGTGAAKNAAQAAGKAKAEAGTSSAPGAGDGGAQPPAKKSKKQGQSDAQQQQLQGGSSISDGSQQQQQRNQQPQKPKDAKQKQKKPQDAQEGEQQQELPEKPANKKQKQDPQQKPAKKEQQQQQQQQKEVKQQASGQAKPEQAAAAPKQAKKVDQPGSNSDSKPAAGTKPPKQQQQPQQVVAKGPVGGTPAAGAPLAGAAGAGAQAKGKGKGKEGGGGGGLLDQMRARLAGGRFRSLNESLYTCSGKDALKMMQDDPSLFQQYHDGFASQVSSWPQQPLALAAQWLGARDPKLVVADFGCGTGDLALKVKQKVHSFDLVAAAPHVVACNMAHVPLEDASVDVAVFSLALMGTDYGSFLREAARVVRYKGWLWIAEVRSRFASGSGGDGDEDAEEDQEGSKGGKHKVKGGGKQGGGAGQEEDNLRPFLKCLGRLGFNLVNLDTSNRMFFVAVLRKTNPALAGPDAAQISWPDLRACVYKKR